MEYLKLKTIILTTIEQHQLVTMWNSAVKLLSHEDKEVKDLALFAYDIMREIYPKEILERLVK